MQCRADIELAARITPGRRRLICPADDSTASSAAICRASASTIRATARWSMPLCRTGTSRTRRDEPGRPPPCGAIMSASLRNETADQSVAGHHRQAGCSGGQCQAPSPLPSAAPPTHCQPGGGAHGEQPGEPGPTALHDGDDPPQPHRDQEQTDAASQQAARQRTPRIAHHHHLLEDCAGGTCLATADSSQGLLVLVRPLAVARHGKARDTDVGVHLVAPHRPGLVRLWPTAGEQL